MDAADIWTICIAGGAAVIAIVAAVASWKQVGKAGEQVEVARDQARIAEDSARSARTQAEAATEQVVIARDQARIAEDSAAAARTQAEAAMEQLGLAKAQLIADRVEQVRGVHEQIRHRLRSAIDVVDPPARRETAELRSKRNTVRAWPHVHTADRFIQRMRDIGEDEVAKPYSEARHRTSDLVEFLESLPGVGALPQGEIPEFAREFERLREIAWRAIDVASGNYRRWRDEQS